MAEKNNPHLFYSEDLLKSVADSNKLPYFLLILQSKYI